MDIFKWLAGEEPNIFEQLNFMFTHGFDTGAFGEYLTEYMFGNNNIEGFSKSLHNIYIPYRGKTSEIDILLIHEKGLYVIESKNYSGWIFGSENQSQWTQMLNQYTKNRFYNPVKQNETHIKALCSYININTNITHSYIVFSERCELKKVPDNTEQYTILRRHHLLHTLRKDLEARDKVLSEEQVNEIYRRLQPLTNVSEEVKKQHIDRIKKEFQ